MNYLLWWIEYFHGRNLNDKCGEMEENSVWDGMRWDTAIKGFVTHLIIYNHLTRMQLNLRLYYDLYRKRVERNRGFYVLLFMLILNYSALITFLHLILIPNFHLFIWIGSLTLPSLHLFLFRLKCPGTMNYPYFGLSAKLPPHFILVQSPETQHSNTNTVPRITCKLS